VPFSTDAVSTELRCPGCGHYIRDITLDDAYELLVANILEAKCACPFTSGYDVYDSALFPGTTFQVKYASAREGKTETKTVNGREDTWKEAPTWSWSDPANEGADFYILFGILGDLVYPFIVRRDVWMRESYDAGKGHRFIRISTKAKSRCGRYLSGYKRNKFWQYAITDWPRGLFMYIKLAQRKKAKASEEFSPHCILAGEQLQQLSLSVGN